MTQPAFPKPQELLLESALYQTFGAVDADARWAMLDALYFSGNYDCYCTLCRREATFQATPPTRPDELKRDKRLEDSRAKLGASIPVVYPPAGLYTLNAKCTRMASHTQSFVFLVQQRHFKGSDEKFGIETTIQKIGQHPSFADLHLGEVKRYAPVLTDQQLGELSRGIGLASHDVGIGAFVYLRRIFEALVGEAHALASQEAGWDEELYQRSRMSERISLLRSHLPTFLVEHPGMYSLLSKGIHELTEQECLTHFDTLRVATELILDERLEAKLKSKKIAAAKTALSKATGGAA
jgi:hypothetical protein